MNRKFEERKPTKVYVKSKENQTIIKALNMYGRVPEMWELLQEIDKYKEVLDKIKEHLLNYIEEWQDSEDEYVKGKIDLARDVLCDIEGLLEEIE